MVSKILSAPTLIVCLAGASFADGGAEMEISSLFGNPSLGEYAERVSASAGADYESEYVFRGKQLAKSVICPGVDISYTFKDGLAGYIGWWGCYSTDGFGYGENDLYAGMRCNAGNLGIDLGYTAYTYTSDNTTCENEIKLKFDYDTSEFLGDFAVNPFVAGYYNFTYEGKTLEFGIAYSAPISKWILSENWGSIDISAFGGAAHSDAGMADGGYMYAGVSADLSVKLTDFWTLSVGVRYATNDNGSYAAVAGRENNVWYSAKTSFGF